MGCQHKWPIFHSALSVDAHHHVHVSNTGRDSEGRQIKKGDGIPGHSLSKYLSAIPCNDNIACFKCPLKLPLQLLPVYHRFTPPPTPRKEAAFIFSSTFAVPSLKKIAILKLWANYKRSSEERMCLSLNLA